MTTLATAPVLNPTSQGNATFALMRDLENPAKYLKVSGVPIFTSFVGKRVDPLTKKEQFINIGEEHVKRVIEKQNSFEKSGTSLARITPGHIIPDPQWPETRQPPPWGWSMNWNYGKLDGKPTIFGDLYFAKFPVPDHATIDNPAGPRMLIPANEYKTFPFRSPEYFMGKEEIGGIALLRRDPQLDLSVLACWHPLGDVFYFAAGGPMTDTPPSPSSPSTPSSPSVKPPHDPTEPPQATAPSQEESEKFMACMQHCYPGMHAMHEHMSKGGKVMDFMMDASMRPAGAEGNVPATASAPANASMPSNPSTPSTATHMATTEEALKAAREEGARMKGEELSVQFKRYEERLAASEAKTLAAEKAARRKRYEQIVTQLDAEGFMIPDRVKEVERFAEQEEKIQDERAAEIRTCFSRDITRLPYVPVDQSPNGIPNPGPGGPGGRNGHPKVVTTPEQGVEVEKVRMAMEAKEKRRVSFAEAETAYFSAGKS
jgi:hypothetical protein